MVSYTLGRLQHCRNELEVWFWGMGLCIRSLVVRRTHCAFVHLLLHESPYLYSNNMARSCIESLTENNIHGRLVDMGLGPEDSHTKFSQHPNATMKAFLDYVFLMDATVIVGSGSSFSGTVAIIKGLKCLPTPNIELPQRTLYVCIPSNASC